MYCESVYASMHFTNKIIVEQAANEHSHVALVSHALSLSLLLNIALFLIMRAEAQSTEIEEAKGVQAQS